MKARTSLPTRSFSDAKARLSDVMSEVVHDHQPVVIERHNGKEAMLLLALRDMEPLLDHFRFSTQASVADSKFVLRQPELGLIAGGESFDDAASELEELAVAYAWQFFDRLDFYMQTDRAEQMPWALRIALATPEERRALLVPARETAAAAA